MVRVRVRLGYTMAICLVLQHQVSPLIVHYNGRMASSAVHSTNCFIGITDISKHSTTSMLQRKAGPLD